VSLAGRCTRPVPERVANANLHNDSLVSSREQDSSLLLDPWLNAQGSDKDLGVSAITINGGDLGAHSFPTDQRGAQAEGFATVDTNRIHLFDRPLKRLLGQISGEFWDNLTRRLDGSNLAVTREDPKVRWLDPRPRIYVPHQAHAQYQYYLRLAEQKPELRLEVLLLPAGQLTSQFVRDLNQKPGLLALALEDTFDDSSHQTAQPLPFIVPGGRFNEMYGWDTYFEVLGLLKQGRVDVCEAMVKNHCFCIQYYGKILNANRSYYLGRSQPPFLTSMGLAVYSAMRSKGARALALIKVTVLAAIKEYHTVWTSKNRCDAETGLSTYQGEGLGFPPEVEPSHFETVIAVHSAKHNMTPAQFVEAYDNAEVSDPELDEYLRHDRASRESGHDTTYRFVDSGADLATVDLNSCLFKYENDIAYIIDTCFDGELHVPVEWRVSKTHEVERASAWKLRSSKRRLAMSCYLWNEKDGTFYDYNIKRQTQAEYVCATMLWPLWAGAATPAQAESIVRNVLPKLECRGGIVSSTEQSRGEISSSRPRRQWDYPYGWAPHQMLAWDGLIRYGYHADAERLACRWVSMILQSYHENNGVIVEKYDVTKEKDCHIAEAEYGNQGSDFDSKVQTG
jgi:alpha,alpha-trehalase